MISNEVIRHKKKLDKSILEVSEVQYEVHIQYQPYIKAKLDIAHF